MIEVNVPSSSSLVGIGLEEATKTKTDMLKMLGLTPQVDESTKMKMTVRE